MDTEYIQHYASLGFRMHPLKTLGKTPLLKGWADEATSDVNRILAWFADHPSANLGLASGKESGVTVVDIDPRNGGDATWAALVAKYGEPKAPKARTARGGLHYYFKYFMGVSKLGDGVDVLSIRRNVVLPPSTTPDGAYEWINGLPKAIPVAPTWLLKLARNEAGDRNNTAYRKACAMFRNGASEDTVLEEILGEFGDEFDIEHNNGLRKTVHSASQRAQAPRQAFMWNGADPTDFDEYIASDYGNAQLLVKHVGSDVMFVRDVGWITYRDGRWQFDPKLVQHRFIKIMDYQRVHYAEALERAGDKDVIKELRLREYHFTLSTNNRSVKNGIELAEAMPSFATDISQFDHERTANLLNFPNGTVDLRTGILHPHDRNHFITKICSAPYDLNATAPFWDETLAKIFGNDEELLQYVQMMLGASMMGSQDTRTLFIAYGRTGKNGKSTLFETLAEILGDYADHAELRMLASTDTGNLTELTTRMRIRGARLVLSSEVASSDSMDANMIKRLTGGDTISARNMFQSTITFKPVCSIWLRTNSLPAIKGADPAFWERICVIPFDYKFEGKEELNMRVVTERFKAEASGILNWLVRGAVMWNNRNGGFVVPRRVQELRTMYMSDTDNFADFISEALRAEGSSETKVSTLHRAYTDFCKRRGVHAPTLSAFKQELRSASLLFGDGKVVKGYAFVAEYNTFDM